VAVDDPTMDADPAPRSRAMPWLVVAACSVVALVVGVLLINRANRDDNPYAGEVASVDDPRAPVNYEFTIPEGTGDKIDAGDNVNVLPDVLTVKVGETMRIVNNDSRGHTVGPFFVGKHQTLTQRFSKVGTIIGECSVHPSTRIEIDVVE